ncbi:MAG: PH domain-containing protein [Mycoplasmatota bacterium]
MNKVLEMAKDFKKKYPFTISWRLKKHAKIVNKHLNPGEKVTYVFAAQKNDNPLDIITTNLVVLTNKRLILATKRVVFGYFFTTITPDMFNDLKVKMGIFWGKINIDTINEQVLISNIQKEALPEIETKITEFMMKEKKKNYKIK